MLARTKADIYLNMGNALSEHEQQKKPLVGIVLLNYNDERFTRDCIASISENTYRDIRIVIVDNSLNHSISSLGREFPSLSIHVIENEHNTGFCGGNNQGIRHFFDVGADYILILNNDTIIEKNCIRELVLVAENQVTPVVVTSKIYYGHDRKLLWYDGGYMNYLLGVGKHYGFRAHDSGVLSAPKRVTYTTGCCMLVPRSVYQNFGLMQEKLFTYMDDTEYSMRLARRNVAIIYNPAAVVYHRVSGGTTWRDYSPTYLYYITRNKPYVTDNVAYRAYLRAIGCAFASARIVMYLVRGRNNLKFTQVRSVLRGLRDSFLLKQ